jgi:hypothetical protein
VIVQGAERGGGWLTVPIVYFGVYRIWGSRDELHNVSGIEMFSNRIFLELLHLQIDSQVDDVIRTEAYLPQTYSEPVHKGWR